MASEEPPTTLPTASNVPPMVVTMEAKTTAASSKPTSTPKHRLPVMDCRLLRLLSSACNGSPQDLELLLNGQDRQASHKISVGASADDEEAFLRESLLDGVTVGGDTVLHVVASNIDQCERILNRASPMHRKAQNFLFVQNKNGDTPLHRAARAGNLRMVGFLIDLARGEDDDTSRVKAMLETENNIKATALHEAVRSNKEDIVTLLMKNDAQLAGFPKHGTSPLYLAVLLERKAIAETLYEMSADALSYSGPNGQNALHAAVLRGKDLTRMLLLWNNKLTVQGDENGSTPLHFAAMAIRGQGQINIDNVCLQVLEANPDALYQPDCNGSFPTHVAASVGARKAIDDFLNKWPSCASLQDASGRTFLHVAVAKSEVWIVKDACRNQSLSSILNMQDNDGNTALHLAVHAGNLRIFSFLFANKEVGLSITNEKGETPLDVARQSRPEGLLHTQTIETNIFFILTLAGGKMGIHRQGYIKKDDTDKSREDLITKEMGQVKEASESLCIGSVLIATVTFGATFAMPGGYRADDHTDGGTPTLAGRYAFGAFTLANALAFTLSTMATLSLMSSGSPLQRPRSRAIHLGLASYLIAVSVTSLVAAFALGTYVMLAPVAHQSAIGACVLSSFVLLYRNLEWVNNIMLLVFPLRQRKGTVWTLTTLSAYITWTILFCYWPIIVIFCTTARNYSIGKWHNH